MSPLLRVATAFVCASVLSACVGLAPRPSGDVPQFKHEMEQAVKELECTGTRIPPEQYPAQPQHFTCGIGVWNTAHLTYEPDIKNPEHLGKVKLVWKEWKEGAHIVDEKEEIVKALSFITARFLPNERKTDLVEMFFGKRGRATMTAEYGIRYVRSDMGMAYGNMIELRPRRKHYLMDFGFIEHP